MAERSEGRALNAAQRIASEAALANGASFERSTSRSAPRPPPPPRPVPDNISRSPKIPTRRTASPSPPPPLSLRDRGLSDGQPPPSPGPPSPQPALSLTGPVTAQRPSAVLMPPLPQPFLLSSASLPFLPSESEASENHRRNSKQARESDLGALERDGSRGRIFRSVVAPPVAFLPDCPAFREQVDAARADYADSAEFFRDIGEAARVYIERGRKWSEASRKLSHKMRRPAQPTWVLKMSGDRDADLAEKLGDIGHIMAEFGSMMEQITAAHEMMVHSVESVLVAKVDHFASVQRTELVQLGRQMDESCEAHETALARFLHGSVRAGRHNQNVEPTVQHRAREVTRTRETFELARFTVTAKLAELKARKNFEMAEALTALYYAMRTSHAKSTEALQKWADYVEKVHANSGDQRRAHEHAAAVREANLLEIRQALYVAKAHEVTRFTESKTADGDGGWGHHFGFGHEDGRDKEKDWAGGQGAGAKEGALHFLGGGDKKVAERAVLIAKLSAVAEEHFEAFAAAERLRPFLAAPRPVAFGRRPLEKEGWLFKRSSSAMISNHWNRRWFQLDGSRLYYLRDRRARDQTQQLRDDDDPHRPSEDKGDFRVLVCDCLLATVREVSDPDLRHCFEILSANRRSYMLQAEGGRELASWVDAIRGCIARQLASGAEAPGSHSSQSLEQGPSEVDEAYRSAVGDLQRQNATCADCGAPGPEWGIINVGCLVCIECSGIHRSLGVQVSKVRSLVLDRLEPVKLGIFAALGNATVNEVLEEGLALQSGWASPVPSAPRSHKEKFIRSKYVYHGFTSAFQGGPSSPRETESEGTNGESVDTPSSFLYKCSAMNSLGGVLYALAHGADANWRNPEDRLRCSLAVAAVEGYVEVMEFLLLNGADIHVLDAEQCSVMDVAAMAGHVEVVEFLESKLDA